MFEEAEKKNYCEDKKEQHIYKAHSFFLFTQKKIRKKSVKLVIFTFISNTQVSLLLSLSQFYILFN